MTIAYWVVGWVGGWVFRATEAAAVSVFVMLALGALHSSWHRVPTWGYGTTFIVFFALMLAVRAVSGRSPMAAARPSDVRHDQRAAS